MVIFTKVKTISLCVLEGDTVDVEIDVGGGIPDFRIVGLGDAAVQESKKRVRSAIYNSKIQFPVKKITVNLAPADVKKEGTAFDLAIATGILICIGVIPEERVQNTAIMGELSLDGNVRGVRGILPMICEGRKKGIERFIVPFENMGEVKISGIREVYGVKTLGDTVNFLKNGDADNIATVDDYKFYETERESFAEFGDMSDIAGQQRAKRVVEIAASGGHNILLKGSPGSGKTMLAKRIPGILPPISEEEAAEITAIYSCAGLLKDGRGVMVKRPFRQIGRNITAENLVGGRKNGEIGEISLANHGILFIDEFAELGNQAQEALRVPLEERRAYLTVGGRKFTVPADFMLVAASNPCRCGYLYEEGRCKCTPYQVRNYENKISGPISDRIDIHLEIYTVPYEEIENTKSETSAQIRQRVAKTREIQRERFKKEKIMTNAALDGSLIKKYCELDRESKMLLSSVMEKNGYSMRSYEKILKISRTLADMDERENINENDVAEAVSYRPKFTTEFK